MQISLSDLSTAQTYFTMTQTVLPRPIAWILSENDDAGFNLAPFSYFNAIASDPPIIMFSVGIQPDGSKKDTLVNIEERDAFVINIASVSQLPELNQTSATLAAGVSEVDANNIDTSSIEGFHLPRVSQSKVAMCCTKYEIQTIGNRNQSLILGEIQSIWVDDECVTITEKGRQFIQSEHLLGSAAKALSHHLDRVIAA